MRAREALHNYPGRRNALMPAPSTTRWPRPSVMLWQPDIAPTWTTGSTPPVTWSDATECIRASPGGDRPFLFDHREFICPSLEPSGIFELVIGVGLEVLAWGGLGRAIVVRDVSIPMGSSATDGSVSHAATRA
jgi:hypothetical protein